MNAERDIELGESERQALLGVYIAEKQSFEPQGSENIAPNYAEEQKANFSRKHLLLAFVGGLISCLVVQTACGGLHSMRRTSDLEGSSNIAPPYVGGTTRHNYPPTAPTNAFPSKFPDASEVGYPGPTPTGGEPAMAVTAAYYPVHTGAPALVVPPAMGSKSGGGFEVFKYWGNLSPWYSNKKGEFGVDSTAEVPDGCRLTGLHVLHRHGARYPTGYASYGGPANFSGRLHDSAAGWNGSGQLEFMNDWTYKLGEELLTPFGRQQLFDLGVSYRLKYGFLLENFTESNTLPIFRTESQDRMLHSALNFAIGFFGYPHADKYQQSITIESPGFNNTLAPYETCPNSYIKSKADRGNYYVNKWANIYLKDAHKRLQPQLKGYHLSIEDIYVFQQLCAYETVAIGYSKFCELFTEKEWEGFHYSMDLSFWYNTAFGAPLAKALGVGWVQEFVARLTHTPIAVHNSSTNATLDDDPVTFPLDQSLYVDATHEVVVSFVMTALNLTSFAKTGPLPADHIPKHRSWVTSQLIPFATNMQFQLLSCDASAHSSGASGSQIRAILNDGVVPLTGVRGCPEQTDGMCPLDTFIEAQKETIRETDWEWACHGDWEVPEGEDWETVGGNPPPRK